SIIIGSSRTSRPCWRTQPQLRPDCSPAMWPFSHNTTLTPCFARNHAVETPTMPPPILTTSAEAGTPAGGLSDLSQVEETVFAVSSFVMFVFPLSRSCLVAPRETAQRGSGDLAAA